MAAFSPNEFRVSQDPSLWYKLSRLALAEVGVLLGAGLELGALRECHDALEKILKAICAQQGVLTDKDDTHKLVHLAKKCGVFDILDQETRWFLKDASGLHTDASYPEDEAMFRRLSDPAYVTMVFRETVTLFSKLKGIYETGSMQPGNGENSG
ncbi:MAG: HEPN domain-containing protein [Eggerthellaceae bacterium]|nr:HEPN domain-containing protein [Eggerthellaceae bacterium]